jgi:hypothetical protein
LPNPTVTELSIPTPMGGPFSIASGPGRKHLVHRSWWQQNRANHVAPSIIRVLSLSLPPQQPFLLAHDKGDDGRETTAFYIDEGCSVN